ncbi:MAG: hypothetical protein C4560_00510 [Nitrospiraceae bacterium]|nr:MAG: hypothetical protein C4560_00510 [Nitrospiraceae bacterium]
MSDFSFELLSARFIAAAIRSAPEKLVSPIFASPLSARSPDLCILWHPGYRKKHGLRLFVESTASLVEAFLRGLVKLLIHPTSFGYALYGAIRESILVIPPMCGSEAPDGKYKTPYIETDKNDALFVFGLKRDFGKKPKDVDELPITEKAALMFILMKLGMSALLKIKGGRLEKGLLLLKWFSWVLGLQWLHDYYLEDTLSKIVVTYDIKKIGCIHEMHFYARVVWRVAARYNCKGYTIQHAAFSPGKRWYFCFPEELESGLKLPDVMYVYSNRVSDLLKQYYKNTAFYSGCSTRYSHWKEIAGSDKRGGYFLFVGALARFDNDVLISVLRKLADTLHENVLLRLRLHPFADLSRGSERWINSGQRKGVISLSKSTSLKDDIKNASAVIGMSTTVLEEALIMGRPVIQITHPDYLEYIDIDGIAGVQKLGHMDVTLKTLEDAAGSTVDVDKMRSRLGLNNPVITYKRLFEK